VANVYSHWFGSWLTSSIVTSLWTVPAGFVDVIRQVDWTSPLSYPYSADGAWLGMSGDVGLFAGIPVFPVRGGQHFGLDGHWVIATGSIVQANTPRTGWALRISGYRLTLP
jgi:hypothetical protein